MIEVSNSEATPTKLAYYKELPAGGKTYDVVPVLPGLNLISKADADKVGIGKPGFMYSHIEVTNVAALPISTAVELAGRSVALDALTLWNMTEKRPAVRAKLQEKIAQRSKAIGSAPRSAPDEDAEGSWDDDLIGDEEMPNGFGV